jgi:hypothetical protein
VYDAGDIKIQFIEGEGEKNMLECEIINKIIIEKW